MTEGAGRAVEYEAPMAEVVADFRRTVEQAATRLLALGGGERNRRAPGEEGWTPKQIVGHLVDSAANNHRRFVLGQLTDDLVFDGYAQEDWVRAQKYDAADWDTLVALWRSYNLHLAHVMAQAPEEVLRHERAAHTLDRIAFKTVPADRPAALEYLMRDYVGHLKHHLRQIFPDGN
ncbi:MAG TPA: DinB family protein [Pyrinomonadaceae bacterium]|nr:DinB family protein [Pyrinomonadaceae bacterium]